MRQRENPNQPALFEWPPKPRFPEVDWTVLIDSLRNVGGTTTDASRALQGISIQYTVPRPQESYWSYYNRVYYTSPTDHIIGGFSVA